MTILYYFCYQCNVKKTHFEANKNKALVITDILPSKTYTNLFVLSSCYKVPIAIPFIATEYKMVIFDTNQSV